MQGSRKSSACGKQRASHQVQLRPLSCQSYVKLKHICGDALICQVYGSFGVMGIVYKDCSEADNWSIRFPAPALLLVFLDFRPLVAVGHYLSTYPSV